MRERESRVFGSRTTHVTLPCPSLCFPHSLTWPELYPHHHIHKGLCLQTSPYLWFIAQWRARCLLMVLPAAHGITFFSTRSCSKYVGHRLLLLRLSVHWRSDRTDVCNFLRMMETFNFSLDLLYFRVMDMLSIIFPMVHVHVCCISGCVLYVLSAACGNYQITWSHIMKKYLSRCCCHRNRCSWDACLVCIQHRPILQKNTECS